MTYQATFQGITYGDSPIPYPLSGSSTEETDSMNEVLDSLFFDWIRQKLPQGIHYQTLLSLLDVDLSSIWLCFEIRNETSLMEQTVKEAMPEKMVEYDVVVRIPPKRRYTVDVRVKSIRRGTPRIVEPDWLV